jgi:hypothetical protein
MSKKRVEAWRRNRELYKTPFVRALIKIRVPDKKMPVFTLEKSPEKKEKKGVCA